MSFATISRREWRLHRDLPLDLLAVAAVLAVVLEGAGPRLFGFLGLIFAGLMGPRLAGDERLHGTLEFILTRPVTRERWMTQRFLLGLMGLGTIGVFVMIADGFDLHGRFGRLLAEPLGEATHPAFPFANYLSTGAALVLMYTLCWWCAIGETDPDSIRAQGWTAGLLTLVLCFVLWIVAHVVVHPPGSPGTELRFTEPSGLASSATFAGACSLVSALAFWATRRRWSRMEAVEGAGRKRRGSSKLTWTVTIVFIALVLTGVLMVWLLMARPVDDPQVVVHPASPQVEVQSR